MHTEHTDLLSASNLPSEKKLVQYPIESEGISDTDMDTEAVVCTVSVYYCVAKIIGR